ncbi:MAG TPA: YceI family protein, partial [Thermoanaerobaculia bacterium]
MAKWFFEPGHTAAEFRARHMMVTWVRGHFKNVHGTLEFDPDNPRATSVDATIDARGLWTGDPVRDENLRSADFLDVQNHPKITFRGSGVDLVGADEGKLRGELTIRGVTRPVSLDVRYLGRWETPWWEDG